MAIVPPRTVVEVEPAVVRVTAAVVAVRATVVLVVVLASVVVVVGALVVGLVSAFPPPQPAPRTNREPNVMQQSWPTTVTARSLPLLLWPVRVDPRSLSAPALNL